MVGTKDVRGARTPRFLQGANPKVYFCSRDSSVLFLRSYCLYSNISIFRALYCLVPHIYARDHVLVCFIYISNVDVSFQTICKNGCTPFRCCYSRRLWWR